MTKRKNIPMRRLLVMLLCVAMLTGLVVPTYAEEAPDGGASSEGNVVLDKSTILEEDGTYTISLSGFATGTTTSTAYTSQTPLDIVLVLDASSSMLMYPGSKVSEYTSTTIYYKDSNGNELTWDTGTYPSNTKSNTNLWDTFTHKTHYINSSQTADTSGVAGSILIPVKAGDKIYCSSFKAIDPHEGIRVTYYKANGTRLKTMGPGEVHKEYNKNAVFTAGSYIVVPEGATAMNIPIWDEDTEKVIYNRSLKAQYGPETDAQLKQMRVAILQEVVADFASTLNSNAIEHDQTHKLSIVTYGGSGGSDHKNVDSKQGYYNDHASVNGYNNFIYTNTGMFVNGQFKNYMNATNANKYAGESYASYNPVFNVNQSKTYYYLYTRIKNDDGNYYAGEVRSVKYQDGKWVDNKGELVTPRTGPYSSEASVQFLEKTSVPVSLLTAQDYKDALANVVTERSEIDFAVNRIVARGGTNTELGLEMAANILKNNPVRTAQDLAGKDITGKQIVILFTDGETTNTSNGTYSAIFEQSNAIKDAGATLYTVSCDANKLWMDQISSNTDLREYNSSAGYSDGDYYMNIADMSELAAIFDTISDNLVSSNTSVVLDKTAVMQDIVSDDFVLPEGFEAKDVEISVVDVTTTDDVNYVDGTEHKLVYNSETGTFVAEGEDPITVSVDITEGKVSVTGFDYAKNYVTTAHAGKKLVVKIAGVEMKGGIDLNEAIPTNKETSGITYQKPDGSSTFFKFNVPHTIVTSKSYVMDYAKSIDIYPCEWFTDIIGIGASPVIDFADTIDTKYGTFVGTEVAEHDGQVHDHEHLKVNFTPKTMQWDEPANLYIFGERDQTVELFAANDEVTANVNYMWSNINVIPANNIYYEDDFITTPQVTDENGNVIVPDRVGIVYTGTQNDNVFTNGWASTSATGTGNTESAEGDESGTGAGVHGWQDSLANDTGYSDGSAHEANAAVDATAKASFTFTGTGVDIYSRTNNTTGTVIATLKNHDNNTTQANKLLIMDNLSASGDYFQIPTLSFTGLNYGTYDVEITVTTGASSESRFIYYLDGIRVYNPIQEDELVQEAYGDKEINAVFTEVRDILLDATNYEESDEPALNGAVFIDEITHVGDYDSKDDNVNDTYVDGDNTSSVGVYSKIGPKNEVYLEAGQGITFKVAVKQNQYIYIGLKAPNITANLNDMNQEEPDKNVGTATATVSNGSENKTLSIGHSTDLYYEVQPYGIQNTEDGPVGYITIMNKDVADNQNDGGLLSITKIRTTGTAGDPQILSITADEAKEAANLFSKKPEVDSDEKPVDPEAPVEPETPTEPSEPEVPDVEIENPGKPDWSWPSWNKPDWNKPSKPSAPSTPSTPSNPSYQNPLSNLLGKLMQGFMGWFR